jgi:hypothetical protein
VFGSNAAAPPHMTYGRIDARDGILPGVWCITALP